VTPKEVLALEKIAGDPRLEDGPFKEVIRLSVERIRTLEALLRHARGLLKDALDMEPNGALDARLRAFLAELSTREGT
jgi:hypothetical protein